MPADAELDLWRDVFVRQRLPWGRFLQSALLHAAAFALVYALSLSWLRQQKVMDRPAFDRASLVTYSPEEYLPPLDTGASEAPQTDKGDPVFAKQPILSVPREANNRTQTVVVPPDLKLSHDVALPNIVATGTVVPEVPLDATHSAKRVMATETQVVAPTPDVQFAPNRVVQAGLRSEIIAPPPEVTPQQARGTMGPDTAIVGPPPELAQPRGRVSTINIAASDAVAPAPLMPMAEQHALPSRGRGTGSGPALQAVAPAPSVGSSGGSGSSGRLIALGIHPVAATGPVAVPAGNRRGTFSAGPQGKPGASGTPATIGSRPDANGSGTRGNGATGSNGVNRNSLPAGLHVGALNSGATSSVERNGSGSNGTSDGGGTREMASVVPPSRTNAHVAAPVAEDKITDVDRQVFGAKRFYAMTLNMPNLNSTSGSWDIRFAELAAGRKDGDLFAPVATETSDPGYPLELIRANVQGVVTLYAVIHSDGRVGEIRVLNSPDDRLDNYAARALARWKFLPAERNGKAVPLEAVVKIPFRVRRSF